MTIITEYETEKDIVYPGERVIKTRKINLKEGIPVNEKTWNEIIEL